ncbi:protein FAR1-RELATED SEQUENCE 5 isoform X5 [Macadamia integrifolia]|uniref:protein FAR1-RELATED SEQUENCE 5 isoform X5 n=1 Tax=Macadamia integrifolia TaxID=60698 RepID=UPI001C4FA1F2|nr:protein FAR1-RELATED SEQUENCE 5 isoform X5 [Macadamia integrifolia]
MENKPPLVEDAMMIESAAATELVGCERKGNVEEPYVGMEFESEEAAKMFYDAYATHMGFVMRFDAFRRSLRDGKVICRRLVCNKEGFRRVRPRQSENRKPRAITREGCKAMVMVKREKTGKWVVSRFVKDHNHPMVISSGSSRRSLLLSQTPDLVMKRIIGSGRGRGAHIVLSCSRLFSLHHSPMHVAIVMLVL